MICVRRLCITLLLIPAASGLLFSAGIEEGRDLFRQRRLDDAISVLHAVKDSLPPDQKKEAALLLARCYWTKATHYTKDCDAKFDLFGRGLQVVEDAQEKIGEEAAFYYWRAVLLGERANVRFSLESFRVSEMIEQLCHRAIELDPSYADGGAYLALGRMYYKLPGLFGGSAEESVRCLLLAKRYVEKRPPEQRDHTVYLFLAESYIALREYEKAKRLLQTGLQCPKNPDAPCEDENDYRVMERLLLEVDRRSK